MLINAFSPNTYESPHGKTTNLQNYAKIKVQISAFVFTFMQHMSRLMGKPTICIGENKDADQLRGNREADQRLCFRYSDSTIPLLLKSEISSFYLFSVTVQGGLCLTWSETTLLVFPRGGSISDVQVYKVRTEGTGPDTNIFRTETMREERMNE